MKQLRTLALLSGLIVTALQPVAANAASPWLAAEGPIAIQKILQNTSAPGAIPGVVIASPSTSSPNYYYYWIRDGALTMATVVSLWQSATDAQSGNMYASMLQNYVTLSRQNQLTKTLTGLGEPKFNVDGTDYTGSWGRPQNDGPALRAITLIRMANTLLANGNQDYVSTNLYDSKMPTSSVIKTDLEYVANHWQDPCFDLWEETLGTHFYTRMVQRKALLFGAALANRLGDAQAAVYYAQQANAIQATLNSFWDASRNIIVPTLNPSRGTPKPAGLDVAVILGALHGGMGDGVFDVFDPRVVSTFNAIEVKFQAVYAINSRGYPAVAIGRYPEDVYNGANGPWGNPWVLATLAGAEYHYLRGEIAQGDAYANRVAVHAFADNSLSEQIDRNSGFMTSARDLTWNYAAVLTTLQAGATGHYVPAICQ